MSTNKIVPEPTNPVDIEENSEKCHDVKTVDLTFDEKEQKSNVESVLKISKESQNVLRLIIVRLLLHVKCCR